MSKLLHRTIIITSSIRVSAETEEEIDALSETLCDAADAGYRWVDTPERLAKHINITSIETDAEVIDDGDEDEDDEDGPNDGSELDEIDPTPGPDFNDELN